MNYIYYLKNQLWVFSLMTLSTAIGYTIGCYFEWREPILLNVDNMLTLLWSSFTYIFIVPLMFTLFNKFQKYI
jgi:hypothetical protein